jgi:hypothetical protein
MKLKVDKDIDKVSAKRDTLMGTCLGAWLPLPAGMTSGQLWESRHLIKRFFSTLVRLSYLGGQRRQARLPNQQNARCRQPPWPDVGTTPQTSLRLEAFVSKWSPQWIIWHNARSKEASYSSHRFIMLFRGIRDNSCGNYIHIDQYRANYK